MKVSHLAATEVYGYLPISIDFLQDLTFLTGLNGSGKTTALRLLMGLLAPSVEELIDITFKTVAAVVVVDGKEITIKAARSPDGLNISISTEKVPLAIPATGLQMISDARHRDEPHTPIHVHIAASPVIRAISELSTPMFLGLDRRIHLDEWIPSTASRIRRREQEIRHRFVASSEVSIRRITDAVLSDVNELVAGTLSEVRAAQERLDEELRNQILLDSFRYKPTVLGSRGFPNRSELNRFRERQAAVEKAAAGLRLPVGELQSSLTQFFDRMNRVVDALEEERKKSKTPPKKKARGAGQSLSTPSQDVVEWVMNSHQAERIFRQVQLLEEYVAKRATLHEPIDRFLALANGFLVQTKKQIKVSPRGNLLVSINDTGPDKSLFALSSGERQLVVMLAHLSLNKRLAESGVFIVDEPELSLHIGWQEQFVDAIKQANPKVQLILATHSPAIILERTDNCRSLS
jgi:energy-coupling factor transporter ATP-binding protein EcfA2